MFVKAYNETREHGGINGLTPSEMFLQRLIKSKIYTKKKQESVTTHIHNNICHDVFLFFNMSEEREMTIRFESNPTINQITQTPTI